MTEETGTNNGAIWAVVEVMGHRSYAGQVTEVARFGSTMIQVVVPETTTREGFVKLFASSALYAITPVTEAQAREFAGSIIQTDQVYGTTLGYKTAVRMAPRFELPMMLECSAEDDEDDDNAEVDDGVPF
ncbi:MAG: hypothetical protein KC766_19945 [Myxococcales bacterium]|nr:hypothetical protein [Myxococcales bacterium]